VSYAELVEVVKVGDAEVQWCEEDNLLAGELGEDMEGNDEGAPDELFTDRALGLLAWYQVDLSRWLTTTKFLYPIQLLKDSLTPFSLTQSLQPPSTIPCSKIGPAKRIVTRSMVWTVSTGETGHMPSRPRISVADASCW
jgi:hypothetical protein